MVNVPGGFLTILGKIFTLSPLNMMLAADFFIDFPLSDSGCQLPSLSLLTGN